MKTVGISFFAETEEKRSRFLACLVPYDRFQKQLDVLRKQHPKANHHVTAFRYFGSDKRLHEGGKDDGEPSGSSGTPILRVLQGYDLVNCGVIVTRYFGGVKLGTGGLARAYAGAAKTVIEASDVIPYKHQAQATLNAPFDRVSELERLLANVGIVDRRYTETGVEIVISDDEETVNEVTIQWGTINY